MKTGLSLFLTELKGRAGDLFFRTSARSKIRHAYEAPKPWQDDAPKWPDAPETCRCACFKLCDRIYQTMTPEERALWKAAVKKRGFSGYDLYMSECLTLCNRNENLPDVPSVSGGFGTGHLIPGLTPPPAICGPPPPPNRWDCIALLCTETTPDGEFATLADCLASGCETADRWDCIDYTCVLTDPDGEFDSYAACIASGCEALNRWDCIDGTCIETDPDGQFATREDCIASGCEALPGCGLCLGPERINLSAAFSANFGDEEVPIEGPMTVEIAVPGVCDWTYNSTGPTNFPLSMVFKVTCLEGIFTCRIIIYHQPWNAQAHALYTKAGGGSPLGVYDFLKADPEIIVRPGALTIT